MKTVTLQIGNSDDKLTQLKWSNFVSCVDKLLSDAYSVTRHFTACSPGDEMWQNACWVFTIHPNEIDEIKRELTVIRAKYEQDSAAWTEGETEFV
jgi:hypothetical protein